jgi:hypothetical protein
MGTGLLTSVCPPRSAALLLTVAEWYWCGRWRECEMCADRSRRLHVGVESEEVRLLRRMSVQQKMETTKRSSRVAMKIDRERVCREMQS